ncbi:hypothetical protein L6164_005396 [Bauhinia variegata]|uniref:Uncharacterized protein n=1 Tax=Bauhinia variegata TaxID=167791 RepID=A0ACB9PTB2_BAUVA|nr:hypothetical protein L6164_005396 [Bauhinia variegata]
MEFNLCTASKVIAAKRSLANSQPILCLKQFSQLAQNEKNRLRMEGQLESLHQSKPAHFSADEESPCVTRPISPGLGHPIRKKGTAGVRAWLVIDTTGNGQIVEAGKHAIMRRTGLPGRDLRILDPILSYPSSVLGRERAIVINLEHIKAIITAREVLLLNSRDPTVAPFVEEFQRRILSHHQASIIGANGDDSNQTKSRADSTENVQTEGKQELQNRYGMKLLSFEFVALEACLESACTCLENEAKTLELEANPALDKLTSNISTLNLERVRQIKSRLVTITSRVQKVRDELEHLLDDDEDMAEMYLTEKLVQVENSSALSTSDNIGEDIDSLLQPDMDDDCSYDGENHGTRVSNAHSSITRHLDVQELEMLLEAYFVQIDGTLNELSSLREYVDDTEDYIKIILDDKQNNLLQMGVMLSAATMILSFGVVISGLFGMNFHDLKLFVEPSGMPEFLWTIGGTVAGMVFMYVSTIAWWKYNGIVE